jgi:uncharacterized protein (TIGR03435 family)
MRAVRSLLTIARRTAIADNIHIVKNEIVSGKLMPAIVLGVGLAAGSLFGQAPVAKLAFEVASIKPSEPVTPAMVAAGKMHVGMKIDAARVDIGNFGIMQLICKAYDVKQYQVSGPSWMTAGQRFDIVATLPAGATKEQVPEMLQTLLADRFKLEIHRETKDHSVYAMVVGKGGIKMKESEPDAVAPEGPEPKPAVTGSSSMSISQTKGGAVVSDGTGRQQKMTMSPDMKSMRLESSRMSMAELAEGMSPLVDQPIVDQTGLKGNYQVTLEISMAEMMNAARAAGMAVPGGAPGGGDAGKLTDAAEPTGSIFNSIQSLGLKLESRKAPLAFIVVDRVEKLPTDN